MAAPQPTNLNLQRDVLAAFLPNHEAIKAFESLFTSVGTDIPDFLILIEGLVEELTVELGITDSKATQALDSLQQIANALTLLSQAPPPLQIDVAGDIAQLKESVLQLEQVQPSYEPLMPQKGIWTPVDQSGAGLAFTVSRGTYVKIGPLTVASGVIRYPATASGANAQVGGLPFIVAPVTGDAGFGGFIAFTNAGRTDTLYLVSGGTGFNLMTNAGAFATNAQYTGAILEFTVIYETGS